MAATVLWRIPLAEQPTGEEVGDLHPSLVAQAQVAYEVAPRAVAGASGTLNQEDKDETEIIML